MADSGDDRMPAGWVGKGILVAGLFVSGLAYAQAATKNPLLAAGTLPYDAPPFDLIQDTDYAPAIEAAMTLAADEADAACPA